MLFFKLSNLLRNFRQNTDGATALEYALIAGLIVVTVAGGASVMGDFSGNRLHALDSAFDPAKPKKAAAKAKTLIKDDDEEETAKPGLRLSLD